MILWSAESMLLMVARTAILAKCNKVRHNNVRYTFIQKHSIVFEESRWHKKSKRHNNRSARIIADDILRDSNNKLVISDNVFT